MRRISVYALGFVPADLESILDLFHDLSQPRAF